MLRQRIHLKTEAEIDEMRPANQLVAEVLFESRRPFGPA